MSYDAILKDPVTGETIEIEEGHFMRGGTYQIGGCHELWLNITWNYSKFYYEVDEGGIPGLNGKTGAESIPILEKMIARIEEKYPDKKTDPDYWEPTPGNALKPLYQLIAIARMRPDGVWYIC